MLFCFKPNSHLNMAGRSCGSVFQTGLPFGQESEVSPPAVRPSCGRGSIIILFSQFQMMRRACACPLRCNEAGVYYSDRICGKGRAK